MLQSESVGARYAATPMSRSSRARSGQRCFSLLRATLALAAFALLLFTSRGAHAFAWTIRHGYNQCAPCHVDPSGGGTLTRYGRGVADEAMRTRWFFDRGEEGDEGAPTAAFLFGAVKLPKQLMLQGDVRYMRLQQKLDQAPLLTREIWMQADFAAALKIGHFTAAGSIGYVPLGARAAALTQADEKNLVSRTHWLAYALWNEKLQLRAGRMNLPYGLRIHEHTTWVKSYTRTNIDDQQQYGLSLAYAGEGARAEAMLIAGNFALHPDDFRERGYSAYAEWFASPSLSLGASSLVTYRALDPRALKPTYRHAHGLFGRYATPWQPLVLLTEWDYVLESPRYAKRREGVVGLLQADVEVAAGMHLIATGEVANVGLDSSPLSYGGWFSYAWFFAPHADIRLDSIFQRFASPNGSTDAVTFLVQGHVFL